MKRSRDLVGAVPTPLSHHRANFGVTKFYGEGDIIFTITFPIPELRCTNRKYYKTLSL